MSDLTPEQRAEWRRDSCPECGDACGWRTALDPATGGPQKVECRACWEWSAVVRALTAEKARADDASKEADRLRVDFAREQQARIRAEQERDYLAERIKTRGAIDAYAEMHAEADRADAAEARVAELEAEVADLKRRGCPPAVDITARGGMATRTSPAATEPSRSP